MRTVEFETEITLLVWDDIDQAFWDQDFPVTVKAVVSNVIGEDGRKRPSIEDYEVRYSDGSAVGDENIPAYIQEEIIEQFYEG